jgi:hypothetical protein
LKAKAESGNWKAESEKTESGKQKRKVEAESGSGMWKLKVEEVSGCRKLSALSASAFIFRPPLSAICFRFP